MNLVGKHVIHELKIVFKSLGKGIVLEQDENNIIVEFEKETKSFKYPDAFKSFLRAEDVVIQGEILKEIAAYDAKIEEEKQKEKEAREALWKKKLEEMSQKSSNKSADKKVKRIVREEGKFLTFLVFQGGTYRIESKGGYIWAPKYNHGGGTCHHWDKLLDVRKGDIIFHCDGGYIRAISIVKDNCYDKESPIELAAEDLWAKNGRMVECEYIEIDDPIRHSDYKGEILKYCNVKYAPFDKDGNGNMGYLYDLNRELAKFFVEEMVVKNGYLLKYDFIQEILK